MGADFLNETAGDQSQDSETRMYSINAGWDYIGKSLDWQSGHFITIIYLNNVYVAQAGVEIVYFRGCPPVHPPPVSPSPHNWHCIYVSPCSNMLLIFILTTLHIFISSYEGEKYVIGSRNQCFYYNN